MIRDQSLILMNKEAEPVLPAPLYISFLVDNRFSSTIKSVNFVMIYGYQRRWYALLADLTARG